MMFTDLPRELELEILVRVPATCVTQLKTTCKRWYYALLKEKIIEKNFNLGKGGARQFIYKKDDGLYSVNMDLHNSFDDTSIEFTGKLITLEDSQHVVISTVYQCDGLLLCTTKEKRLVVWNPCTGQTRWIKPSNRNYKSDEYFLGYENNNKSWQSYKILRSSEGKKEFEVYDFNSDSWRLLDGATYMWFIRRRGVSLKGNMYWVAWDMINVSTSHQYLLRFDFKREIFERLSLPFQSSHFKGCVSLSVAREEKLYVFLQYHEMKIWVMDTKIDDGKYTNIQYSLLVDFSEIWSKCRSNVMRFESFLVDEETKKVVCWGRDQYNRNRLEIYIVEGGQNLHVCKQVHGEIAQGGQHDYWQLVPRGSDDYWHYERNDEYIDLLITYIPSLVQLQQVKAKQND